MTGLEGLANLWLRQIRMAEKVKHRQFGKKAERCWDFLGKDFKALYKASGELDEPDSRFPQPEQVLHRTRRNLVAEFVAVMLPYLYDDVPHRLVTPARPELPPELLSFLLGQPVPLGTPITPDVLQQVDPQRAQTMRQDFARAWLMQWFLNYTPGEYDLRGESRKAIIEALCMGRGVLWHELVETPHGLVPGSFFESVRNFGIDPDATCVRDASYIYRRRRRPVWQVAREFGLDPDKLSGQYQSWMDRALSPDEGGPELTEREKEEIQQRRDRRNVVEYYEIYSRMGLGHNFVEIDEDIRDIADAMEALGDDVYIVVCPGVPYPLNLPPELRTASSLEAEIKARLEWPIKYYANYSNPWPMSVLDFMPNTDDPWATPLLAPHLPLLAWLDHAYSYAMNRIRTTCRDIIVCSDEMADQLRNAIVEGYDQQVVGVPGKVPVELRQLFDIVQFPPVNRDLFDIIGMVEQAFAKATGMDALLYGGAALRTQPRSSAEVQIRQQNLLTRPQDMANAVREWQSQVARAEGFAARTQVDPRTVAALFGEPYQEADGSALMQAPQMGALTTLWAQLVLTDNEWLAAAELSYKVESGSGARRNKQKLIEDAALLMQTLWPAYMQYAQATGNTEPANGLLEIIGRAFEIDIDKLKLPPVAPAGPGAGPPPGAPPPKPSAEPSP